MLVPACMQMLACRMAPRVAACVAACWPPPGPRLNAACTEHGNQKRASINANAPPKQDPWFLQELPPNALTMNDHYLGLPPLSRQSEDEIRAVVQAVREARP